MNEDRKWATVFGGTGFVGRQIVRELAKLGYTVKVASRVPESAFFLRPAGVVGQIVPFACDYKNRASILDAVRGSSVVVNCIGILYERRKGDFRRVHAELAGAIASACASEGVRSLVHISIPGIEADQSQYAKTKLEGERAVQAVFPAVTILRPSVIFGADDNFFNKFARLARIMPVLPLIGGGKTKFQPVYVGDVADAAIAAAHNPAAAGRIFELAGPETLTFKEIYELLFRYTGRSRPLVNLPWGVAKVQAFFMALLPSPLLTPDQVESLKTDYVIANDALKLEDLGITPTSPETILPTYLETYRPGGRFAGKTAA
ncbi:MAG: complex I NDUFA9 subunit family protein [Alphaproteobacteria bacterium]